MTTARHAATRPSVRPPARPTGRPRGRAPFRPTVRLARMVGLLVVPLSVVATGLVVAGSSYSAFSSSVTNPGTAWTAGSVAITNDSPGTALFSVANLKPTLSASRCVTVTSTGSLPAVVKLYVTGVTSTNALSSYIDLVVTQGSGGNAACVGFAPAAQSPVVFSGTLATLASSGSYQSGQGAWSTAGVTSGSEARTYQITYTVSATTPNTAQNGTAEATLVWEAQNA